MGAHLGSTRDRLRGLATPGVIVAFSGGKDSLAVLDLAVEVFGPARVAPFFMYLIPGLRCVEDVIEASERRYGIKVARYPHWGATHLFNYSIFQPYSLKGATTPPLRYQDIERVVRHDSGLDWIANGQKATDASYQRPRILWACKGIEEKLGRIAPLYNWTDSDVKAFLRHRKIPLPDPIAAAGAGGGVSLSAASLLALRERYPQDYDRVLEVFPYAEAEVARHEIYGGNPLTLARLAATQARREQRKAERAAVRDAKLHGGAVAKKQTRRSAIQPPADRSDGEGKT